MKNTINYYLRVADKAHEIYLKRGGKYILQWQGFAKGYTETIETNALFKDCLEQAKEIVSNENN